MKVSKLSGIYRITSPSGRVYVGQSVDIGARWRSHKSAGRSHRNRILAASFGKYGVDAHLFEVVEVVKDHEELDAREQAWIDDGFASGARMMNLHTTAGSARGYKHGEEFRHACSERFRKIWNEPARKAQRSVETRERNLERFKDPAERRKHSERMKARFDDPAYRKKVDAARAKSLTPESLARRSEASRKRYEDPENRIAHGKALKVALEASPERRNRISAILQERNANPEFKAKVAAKTAEPGFLSRRGVAIMCGRFAHPVSVNGKEFERLKAAIDYHRLFDRAVGLLKGLVDSLKSSNAASISVDSDRYDFKVIGDGTQTETYQAMVEKLRVAQERLWSDPEIREKRQRAMTGVKKGIRIKNAAQVFDS